MESRAYKLATYSLYCVCFFVFFSTALTAIFSALMLIFWFVSGTWKNITEIVEENPITKLAFFLFLLFFVGVFYSQAPLEDALDFFKKNRGLLCIPIVISLCREDHRIGSNVIYAFFIGYSALLINAYLVDFSLIPSNKFAYDRHGGGFLVIFAYLTMQHIVLDKKRRYYWIGFFTIIFYDLFFILNTRTGWVLFVSLSLLFLAQYFSLKKQLIFTLSLVLACIITYQFSSSFHYEIHKTITSLKTYNIKAQNSKTDLGVRLDWYQNSIELIKKKPLLGYGTGSFLEAQEDIIKGKDTVPSSDPHNEYLLVGVQIGMVGVVFFLLVLFEPILHSFKLTRANQHHQAYALQAVVAFLAVGCLFNSWLLTSIPSDIFAILLAVFYPFPENIDADDSSLHQKPFSRM